MSATPFTDLTALAAHFRNELAPTPATPSASVPAVAPTS